MIIYSSDLTEFIESSKYSEIAPKIEAMFFEKLHRRPAAGEVRAWTNSLARMGDVLRDAQLDPKITVSVEFGIPATSKRVDVILSGYDGENNPVLVIVELKQWEMSEAVDRDGILNAPRFGGKLSFGPHPSYQAWTYASLLRDFNEAVYRTPVKTVSCAYLHNHKPDPNGESIRSECYRKYLDLAPVFLSGKADYLGLIDFVRSAISKGDARKVIGMVEKSPLRPSRELASALSEMLKGNRVFTLIDEQKVVYEEALAALAEFNEKKFVLLVRGGPGTGKSVVAVNLLVEMIRRGKNACYVTKNAAPRNVYQTLLKKDKYPNKTISMLFKSPDKFHTYQENTYDCVIVDEAHRLREKSGVYANEGENQIREIIRASRLSVFFSDDRQRIHMKDAGSAADIIREASDAGAVILELSLPSQFRCSGSDGYLSWLDNRLGIEATANHSLSEKEYDFRVYESASAMTQALRECAARGDEARLLAGYCWEWKSKKDPDAADIILDGGDFSRQWNLEKDGGLWLLRDRELAQVGCIHTSQGLEVSYVGVIVGPDFLVRDGCVVTDFRKRARSDASVKGLKTLEKKDPEKTEKLAAEIIANTYRVLMTRGTKGCFIFSEDEETRDWFRSALCR